MSVSRWLRESTVDRRKFLGRIGGMSAVLATAACASTDPVVLTQTVTPGQPTANAVTVPPAGGATTSATAAGTTAATNARIIASPKFGATDVAPTAGITVTTFNAKIADLTVTGSDGRTVAGTIDAGGATWSLTDRLRFDTVYTFAGTATDTAGTASPIEGQITTVNPSSTMGITFIIADNDTFGVGQPIVIQFNGVVQNRAAAEKALIVTTDKGDIVGGWGWLQDEDIRGQGLQSQVHWRPKEFWPANTKVSVEANLYGVDFGNGNWGGDDVTRDFAIGRSLIATADVNSFRLKVEQDGVEIRDYPVSYGKGDGDRATRSGIHVVQAKYPDFEMCNAAFNYCGVKVTWAVRINNNGEFIHENDKTIPYQGIANVSHGCVNMSTANAKDFYDMAIIGDPVLVSNTGQDMTAADYIYDWIYSWDNWRSLSAL
ncbi:MAG: Ig-like domain-containing protein [Nakamurella sp.]